MNERKKHKKKGKNFLFLLNKVRHGGMLRTESDKHSLEREKRGETDEEDLPD